MRLLTVAKANFSVLKVCVNGSIYCFEHIVAVDDFFVLDILQFVLFDVVPEGIQYLDTRAFLHPHNPLESALHLEFRRVIDKREFHSNGVLLTGFGQMQLDAVLLHEVAGRFLPLD